MAHFLETLIEDRPCNKCPSAPNCRAGECLRWQDWFSATWHELQNLFLYRK